MIKIKYCIWNLNKEIKNCWVKEIKRLRNNKYYILFANGSFTNDAKLDKENNIFYTN